LQKHRNTPRNDNPSDTVQKSTGAYGYPKQAAARIALAVMREHVRESTRVIVCCFGIDDAALYLQLLADIPVDRK
jgi:O-acetyl-ADP-ribose deacetylase (regulator of RNase III)